MKKKVLSVLCMFGVLCVVGVCTSQLVLEGAHVQGETKCPEARLLADGSCCRAGQRAKGDKSLMKCEADPNAEEATGGKKAASGKKRAMSSPSMLRGEHPPAVKPSKYVKLQAGSFMMGSRKDEEGHSSDERQVRVTLTRSFWLKATEVTQGEWEELMGENPSGCDEGCSKNHPVQIVSWFDAAEYMNRLSLKQGLEQCYEIKGTQVSWPKGLDCKGYRLPTEAEWEYAARAGSISPSYGALDNIAWYQGNSGGKMQVVATKRPNAAGLHDMLGNVYEWTWDVYSEEYAGDTDPIGGGLGPQSVSTVRVFRGCYRGSGSWGCRAATRDWGNPGLLMNILGLRPARSDL